MATIPMGNAGRAMPGRVPLGQGQPVGLAEGRALERAGAEGAQATLQMQSDATRVEARAMAEQQQQAEQERRRQEATAEAAARAKDAVALQTAEDRLADLHDEIAAGVLQGTVAKDKAGEQWTERSRKAIDESLPALRDGTRQLVAPRLEGAALRLGNTLRRTVEKKDRQDVTADMSTRLERLSRDYMVDPKKAEAEAMATFDTLGPFSSLTSEQLARGRQSWKEQAQFTTAYEAVSKGRADRGALKAAEELIGKLPDLDPQKRAGLLDRTQAYRLHLDQQDELRAQRAARAEEARLRKAEATFTTFQGLADKGTLLDPGYVDQVLAATAGTPYQAGVSQLAAIAKENSGFASQPLGVQRATLDALDRQIATQGRSPALDKHRAKLEQIMKAGQADAEKDPLRAGLERGVITELQPLNLAAGIPGLTEQLAQRVQQAEKVGRWAGRPSSPLTPEESATVAGLLGSMSPDQKGQAVQLLASTIPPAQAQAMALQIDKHDKPLALALAVGTQRTTQGRATAEIILRGAQAVKDKGVKEDKGAEFGLRASLAKEIGDSITGKAREDIIEAARYIHLGKQAGGESVNARSAVELAIGGPLIEHNGRRIPVLPGMDQQTLKQRLQAFPERAIAAQADDGFVYLPGGRPLGVPEFLVTLPDAQLEPAGLGRFMVRSGGSLVLGKERRPVVVDLR